MNQRRRARILIVLACSLLFWGQARSRESDLIWSTFVGGDNGDVGWAIAVDAHGCAYLSGYTSSANFPTTAGAFDRTYNDGGDVFVAKLDPTGGALTYSTLIGGDSYDMPKSIAIDDGGNAYVTGETYSAGFPTTEGAFDETHNGGKDAFVVKLDAAGSSLGWSTFLGGTHDDRGLGIAVDREGTICVTGQTYSPDFPSTENAFDVTHNGDGDIFVVKLNATGSALGYATFVGGSGDDFGRGLALDGFGNSHITGYTTSANFPATSGALDTTHNGAEDVFVAELDPTGSVFSYATFLGGEGDDKGFGIALDGAGNVYVAGHTKSGNFPTTDGAVDTTLGGEVDVFVAKLDASGRAVDYITYLGGSGLDYGHDLAVDGSGRAHLTGYTKSADFPVTTGAFDGTYNGDWDLFVAKLNATGDVVDYATFLGGSKFEKCFGIALDGSGDAYLTGYTWSVDFPTTPAAYRAAYTGKYADAFVVKLRLDDER